MKKMPIILILFLVILPFSAKADDQAVFQEMIRTILVTGGEIKEISDTLRPNTRLYIYKQLPSMKNKINKSEKAINDIREKAVKEIKNSDMQNIVQDMASMMLLTINVTKELLATYESTGSITQKDYDSVVSKYDREAKRLQRNLERYKNM